METITVVEYTGRRAAKCDGTTLEGEFVIQYEHRSTDDRWTATARTRTAREVLSPPFDILDGTTSVQSGDRQPIDSRMARALVAPWPVAAGPQSNADAPPGTTQSLWIDTASLLPLRWSIHIPSTPERGIPEIPDYGVSFIYDPSIAIERPPGVTAPDCVR